MNKQLIKIKIQAMLVHFLISLAIFAVIAYLLRYYFYPEFHFSMNGGMQGFTLMFYVDVVLGPLLTFMVYNRPPAKSRGKLHFDFLCIAIVQFSALFYGAHTVYKERPVLAILYNDGNATIVNARELASDFAHIDPKKIAGYKRVGGIPLAFYRFDANLNQRIYQNVTEVDTATMEKVEENINRFLEPEKKEMIQAAVQRAGRPVWYFAMIGKYTGAYVIVDRNFNFIELVGEQEIAPL